MRISYTQLRQEIKRMKRRTKLYKLLKEELSLQGYWKNKPRGNPFKAYKNMLNKMSIRQV